MDGLQDKAQQVGEGAGQEPQGAPAQVSDSEGAAASPVADDGAAKACEDYEAALRERDARIAELEGEIAEAAKTAEGAEKLRAEMDELRRKGDEERVGFELQLAGARSSPTTTTTWRSSRPRSPGSSRPLPPPRTRAQRGCRAQAPPGPTSRRR